MEDIIFTILAVIALVVIGSYFLGIPPRKYSGRNCMGKHWRRAFPSVTKDDIRVFLEHFTQSFAFHSKYNLHFSPSDKVLDIYRLQYPNKNFPDMLELETLTETMQYEYGIDIANDITPDATLGDIFQMTIDQKTTPPCPQ